MAVLLLPLCLAALAGAAAPATPVQDPSPPPAVTEDEDIHAQMRELVRQIERTLREVDDLLWDRRTARVPPSVAERLAHARDGARKAVEQIDQLLGLAHEHQSGGT